MPTGADVAGTYSILSLILSLCLLPRCVGPAPSLFLSLSHCLFLYLSLPFFLLSTRWRDAPLQTFLTQDHNAPESCDLAFHRLPLDVSFSLSLSIHKRSLSLFPSVLFPLTKADKGLSFLLACLCSVCLYCTKLGSLSHCIPSFPLQRRCLGAPGPLL